jgi:hypothetical protein
MTTPVFQLPGVASRGVCLDERGAPPFSQLAEDEWWFDRFPGREFRLRIATPTERPGEVPAAAHAYVIVSRSGTRQTFAASGAFDPGKSDAQLRQLFANLSAARRAAIYAG